MFVVKIQEMNLVEQTHSLYTPLYSFSQWVTCGNEMARNHPKHEFLTKSSGLGMLVRKNKKWFRGHKLMPFMHPDTRFRYGSRAATKWRETAPNMNFEPKVLVSACSL